RPPPPSGNPTTPRKPSLSPTVAGLLRTYACPLTSAQYAREGPFRAARPPQPTANGRRVYPRATRRLCWSSCARPPEESTSPPSDAAPSEASSSPSCFTSPSLASVKGRCSRPVPAPGYSRWGRYAPAMACLWTVATSAASACVFTATTVVASAGSVVPASSESRRASCHWLTNPSRDPLRREEPTSRLICGTWHLLPSRSKRMHQR
ncbi:hypothetical protein FOZ61_000831, partial [Perkinsus olseni]